MSTNWVSLQQDCYTAEQRCKYKEVFVLHLTHLTALIRTSTNIVPVLTWYQYNHGTNTSSFGGGR